MCFGFELNYCQPVLGMLLCPLLVFCGTLSLAGGSEHPGDAPMTLVLDTRWRWAVDYILVGAGRTYFLY